TNPKRERGMTVIPRWRFRLVWVVPSALKFSRLSVRLMRNGSARRQLIMSELAPPNVEPLIEVQEVPLLPGVEVRSLPRFDRPLQASVREVRLLTQPPWIRPIGKLTMDVSTQGWRFPTPGEMLAPVQPRIAKVEEPEPELLFEEVPAEERPKTRLRPPSDAV